MHDVIDASLGNTRFYTTLFGIFAVLGVVIGIALAFALTRLLAGLLFEVTATEPSPSAPSPPFWPQPPSPPGTCRPSGPRASIPERY